MDIMQGKHFSITDPEGVKTVIYQINKTEKEFQKEKMVFLVENGRLNLEDYTSLIDQDYQVCAPLGEYHFLPKYEGRIK